MRGHFLLKERLVFKMSTAPSICINGDSVIEIEEPVNCRESVLSPEGNIKFRNYRLIGPGPAALRAYTPTGDINTTPIKRKVVPRFEESGNSLCAPILQLIKVDDIESHTLKDIVNPNASGLARKEQYIDNDFIAVNTDFCDELNFKITISECALEDKKLKESYCSTANNEVSSFLRSELERDIIQTPEISTVHSCQEASPDYAVRNEGITKIKHIQTLEEERNEIVNSLSNMILKVDNMLTESRSWHKTLARIHEDLQLQEKRAADCLTTATNLQQDASALFFLDHMVTMLRGEVDMVPTLRNWPFSQHPARNGSTRNFVI